MAAWKPRTARPGSAMSNGLPAWRSRWTQACHGSCASNRRHQTPSYVISMVSILPWYFNSCRQLNSLSNRGTGRNQMRPTLLEPRCQVGLSMFPAFLVVDTRPREVDWLQHERKTRDLRCHPDDAADILLCGRPDGSRRPVLRIHGGQKNGNEIPESLRRGPLPLSIIRSNLVLVWTANFRLRAALHERLLHSTVLFLTALLLFLRQINTCNGFYCDNFRPHRWAMPKMWTENWDGW
jgi:hypothetical protein